MADKYDVMGTTVFKPSKRIRQMLAIESVGAHITLTSNSDDKWRLCMDLPGGRIEVQLDAAGFSRLMRSQYAPCIVELRGRAKHAGMKSRGFACDVKTLPKDVQREDAWSKTEQYGKEDLDLRKFPKLRAFVVAKTQELKLSTSCVTFQYSQSATTMSITEIV